MRSVGVSSMDALKPGSTIVPEEYLAVASYVQARRLLYEGDFSSLGVHGRVDGANSTINTSTAVNWFRRAATIYPEFMMSHTPEILIEGASALQQYADQVSVALFDALKEANVGALAYGRGVIATHPLDTSRFQVFDRDQHYEVKDIFGRVTGDILVSVRGTLMDKKSYVDVFRYPVDDGENATWSVYKSEAGSVGALQTTMDLGPRPGRQVVPLSWNPEATSIFDDMTGHVGMASKFLDVMGDNVEKNGRPHLYGPDGIVVFEEDGTPVIDMEGMFFPLQEGDTPPGYLQWDTNTVAVRWGYEREETNALTMAGLTQALFDPTLLTGLLSGSALVRVLIPFQIRVLHLARVNERAIAELLNMNWRVREDVPDVQIDENDLEVEWHFDEILAANFEEMENERDENRGGDTESGGRPAGS